MWLALVGPNLLTILAMLVLLIGVPVFVVVVLAVVSGYIRYDAEQRLAALEEDADEESAGGAETAGEPTDEDR
ncbi:hypothetical protein CV102_08050 [Natronococcus pandeyae]|uniref:Uncharacterized protein n=1 Tax=Natronococcus pandeyae TaxID=2055836 RepID=A0A8J8Q5Z5_9EURY|nr:hypothetical protein [Natronococcus pandeyae]TYL39228.1 hypothetical protein CV102_08050 [Natronococcus pandeyae]